MMSDYKIKPGDIFWDGDAGTPFFYIVLDFNASSGNWYVNRMHSTNSFRVDQRSTKVLLSEHTLVGNCDAMMHKLGEAMVDKMDMGSDYGRP